MWERKFQEAAYDKMMLQYGISANLFEFLSFVICFHQSKADSVKKKKRSHYLQVDIASSSALIVVEMSFSHSLAESHVVIHRYLASLDTPGAFKWASIQNFSLCNQASYWSYRYLRNNI